MTIKNKPSSTYRASTLYDVEFTLIHIKQSLNPAMPVLPIGVSRHFWAMDYVHTVVSPNEDIILILFKL